MLLADHPGHPPRRLRMLRGLDNARIFADAQALSRAAAERCLALARAAISARGRFAIALSGGSTPESLYTLLAQPGLRTRTDWSRWQVFFGDERCVAVDHADSNYRMAREALLEHVPIPAEQIHPMVRHPEDPQADAADYAALLQRELPMRAGIPLFDLILLGLGPDGHTASLFPQTAILEVQDHSVAAVYVSQLDTWRVSLTYPVLNHARHLVFLVAGTAKASVIDDLRRGIDTPYPAQRLDPKGEIEWYLDRAAAGA